MSGASGSKRGGEVAGGAHSGVGHVVPLRVLLSVLAVLLILTWATVEATWLELGSLNLWIALGIAVTKASLVVLYFMHLRYDRPMNAVVFISALAFLMLFVGLALVDSSAYHPDLMPGYAPALGR